MSHTRSWRSRLSLGASEAAAWLGGGEGPGAATALLPEGAPGGGMAPLDFSLAWVRNFL